MFLQQLCALYFHAVYILYVGKLIYPVHLQLGVNTVPVLVGPFTYLRLAKPGKGVDTTFDCLSLIESILPVYQ